MVQVVGVWGARPRRDIRSDGTERGVAGPDSESMPMGCACIVYCALEAPTVRSKDTYIS